MLALIELPATFLPLPCLNHALGPQASFASLDCAFSQNLSVPDPAPSCGNGVCRARAFAQLGSGTLTCWHGGSQDAVWVSTNSGCHYSTPWAISASLDGFSRACLPQIQCQVGVGRARVFTQLGAENLGLLLTVVPVMPQLLHLDHTPGPWTVSA